MTPQEIIKACAERWFSNFGVQPQGTDGFGGYVLEALEKEGLSVRKTLLAVGITDDTWVRPVAEMDRALLVDGLALFYEPKR